MARVGTGLSVVIPAYNERNSIAGVVQQAHAAFRLLPETQYEVIVVDDGSTDDTAAVLQDQEVVLIRHPKNYGYGRSLLTGIERARYSVIGMLDADGTYDPADLARLLPLMGIFDMVIGARHIVKQNCMVVLLRIILKSLIYILSEHYSPDPNSGLRLFRKDLIRLGCSLMSLRFSFSTSLTFIAALNGKFIEYVPIAYRERTGESKVRHVRDSLRTFFLIMSMGLVYQPVKCFAGHLMITLAGLWSLFSLRSRFGREGWLTAMVSWLSGSLLMALSFLGFILSKVYGQQHSSR